MTRLVCGQLASNTGRWSSSCTNDAKFVDADDITLHNLYCTGHKAGNTRRKYAKKNLVPIQPYLDKLIQLKKERDSEQNKRRADEMEVHHLNMLASMERDWNEVDQPSLLVSIDAATEETWNNDLWRWEIYRVGQRHREQAISVSDNASGFNDVILPVEIRWTGTSAFDAKCARELANALNAAADLTDAINKERRPSD